MKKLYLLHSFVLQGASIVLQQKYIELFLVADNREVRYKYGTFLWKLGIKQKIIFCYWGKFLDNLILFSHSVILVRVPVSSWIMWVIFNESTAAWENRMWLCSNMTAFCFSTWRWSVIRHSWESGYLKLSTLSTWWVFLLFLGKAQRTYDT